MRCLIEVGFEYRVGGSLPSWRLVFALVVAVCVKELHYVLEVPVGVELGKGSLLMWCWWSWGFEMFLRG